MPHWICQTCAAEFPDTATPPDACPICEDERQYVKPEGQKWTTADELLKAGHNTELRELEPGLLGIGVTPQVGIGQRALLIEHPEGGILWEGVPVLDDEAVAEIKRRGGVRAIVSSHPHLYGAITTNAQKLGDVPIIIPKADRHWLMNPSPKAEAFEGDYFDLGEGITLHVTGGHFPGSSILHWPQGANGQGVLFTGDTILPTPSMTWVSFMYSYPNLIPLHPDNVRAIVKKTEPLAFDRLYSSWWSSVIPSDAKVAIARSAERYIKAMGY